MKKYFMKPALIVAAAAGILTGCRSTSRDSAQEYSKASQTEGEQEKTTGQEKDRSRTKEAEARTGAITEEEAAFSLEEAKQTVLSRVPGAADTDMQISLDTDDGVSIYEGKIIYDNIEYEFEIDARTGEMLEWSSESVFD